MAQEKFNTIKLIKKFFLNYMWAGFVLLLWAIIVDLSYSPVTRNEFTNVFIKLLDGVGVAILVASIFSFASGTTSFINRIQKLLESIVISRSFLSNIPADEKKDALKSLIQPSASEKNKYPNIGDYYGHYIDKTMTVGKKNVRSNYAVYSHAKFDSVKGKVFVESTFSYRLFPSSEGYNDITIGFCEPTNGDSSCQQISICNSQGVRDVTLGKDLEFFESTSNGDVISKANVKIKSEFESSNHVDVEIKIKEYGNDHWQLLYFTALQPTDGFSFRLVCENGVTIKKHSIFMVGAPYYLDISTDNKDMSLSCNRWIDEGSGLCVVISHPGVDA